MSQTLATTKATTLPPQKNDNPNTAKSSEALRDRFNVFAGNLSVLLSESSKDTTYEQAKYRPTFPNVKWDPLKPMNVLDRGHYADPKKGSLFAAATEVDHLTPLIGTEISGVDLKSLSDAQKDELALLVAERGVVFFRNQDITIEKQLELGRYFGPLHKHPGTGIPEGLPEVHVVYTDPKMRANSSAFARRDIWHSDVTYELQPPGLAILKLICAPPYGGDTLWSSSTALYSSLSPQFQKYLESLQAIHDGRPSAESIRSAGFTVRREPIVTSHPVVRVHPVTGWKSIFVNPSFTTRIAEVSKVESDFVLQFLSQEVAENPELSVRFKWKKNDVAIWDNRRDIYLACSRIVTHSAILDSDPFIRHGLRVTHHGEKPLSVSEYEGQFGRAAQDRNSRLEVDPEQHGLKEDARARMEALMNSEMKQQETFKGSG